MESAPICAELSVIAEQQAYLDAFQEGLVRVAPDAADSIVSLPPLAQKSALQILLESGDCSKAYSESWSTMCSPAELALNGPGGKATVNTEARNQDGVKGLYNVFYRRRMRHIVAAVEESLMQEGVGEGLANNIQNFVQGFSGTWTQFWQSTEAMFESKIPDLERGWLHDGLQTLGRRMLSAGSQEK
jgi:hypothetical protein